MADLDSHIAASQQVATEAMARLHIELLRWMHYTGAQYILITGSGQPAINRRIADPMIALMTPQDRRFLPYMGAVSCTCTSYATWDTSGRLMYDHTFMSEIDYPEEWMAELRDRLQDSFAEIKRDMPDLWAAYAWWLAWKNPTVFERFGGQVVGQPDLKEDEQVGTSEGSYSLTMWRDRAEKYYINGQMANGRVWLDITDFDPQIWHNTDVNEGQAMINQGPIVTARRSSDGTRIIRLAGGSYPRNGAWVQVDGLKVTFCDEVVRRTQPHFEGRVPMVPAGRGGIDSVPDQRQKAVFASLLIQHYGLAARDMMHTGDEGGMTPDGRPESDVAPATITDQQGHFVAVINSRTPDPHAAAYPPELIGRIFNINEQGQFTTVDAYANFLRLLMQDGSVAAVRQALGDTSISGIPWRPAVPWKSIRTLMSRQDEYADGDTFRNLDGLLPGSIDQDSGASGTGSFALTAENRQLAIAALQHLFISGQFTTADLLSAQIELSCKAQENCSKLQLKVGDRNFSASIPDKSAAIDSLLIRLIEETQQASALYTDLAALLPEDYDATSRSEAVALIEHLLLTEQIDVSDLRNKPLFSERSHQGTTILTVTLGSKTFRTSMRTEIPNRHQLLKQLLQGVDADGHELR